MATFSITEANRSGISGLISSAEAGERIALSRHGRVVAELVSATEIEIMRRRHEDLLDAALVLARYANDNGDRHELDDLIDQMGYTRADLEHELDQQIRSGKEQLPPYHD
ncbi:type II toxin-antitoxin system Phd/YefM family antitoxin [Corynebacterium aquatimens]|uniref:Antitoxin (DNA-binding transcriptional repressor) of toxin-antitoxin stability system n=1 Tax=Corynebacterium aquatimens TaxID=1190508 RepID=A0A931E0Z8_9CORY|nr:type II toxin-antitoxin system Phd/YefM family antitoxin [Corynebacterium aquatimens]MBG6122719.1 antitoxin (DNA-binding transcriptional repressor) of toxin-antitoxin stability system [Corynebacterium aquatimens]WJY66944.1 hypothetical protein CAQUA_11305 [Corynebacterium aquatimens]